MQMKKRTEKQPVDDLFARRLKNMSLPPNPDGFARLQAQMGQSEPERRVVFWQNPVVQRYMAVAACLLLTCLFGWLYLTTETPRGSETTVAVNRPATLTEEKQRHEQSKSEVEVAATGPNSDRQVPNLTAPETTNSSLAESSKLTVSPSTNDKHRIATATRRVNKTAPQAKPTVTPTGELAKTETNSPSAEPITERQIATTTDKPTPVTERVLVVTIAEPKAVIAARQLTKQPNDEEDVAAVTDKSEKDSKAASLWQQVKRVKQGEIFARKDAGEDERGLLGRAYSGLKQTFDKDKSIKQ
jgi:hypothetical protein